MLFRHMGAEFYGRTALDRGEGFHVIAPVAIHLPSREAEARRNVGVLGPAAGNGWFEATFHFREHKRNK